MKARKILLIANFMMLVAGIILLINSILQASKLKSALLAVIILWNLMDIVDYFKKSKGQ